MPTPPPDQRFRQVGFLLTGGPEGDVQFTFGLRPEELTVTEPSRLNVQQTLGGAWADVFDRGIATINISGHNGWRGGPFLAGEDAFADLRTTVFQGWHDARAAAVASGGDPDAVQLLFTDDLDRISAIVAPRSFTLRRSKSSPLLMRYQIQLLVLGDVEEPEIEGDPIVAALSNPMRWVSAINGLRDTILLIQRYELLALGTFGAFADPIRDFIGVGVDLIGSIIDTAVLAAGVFTAPMTAILTVGIEVCQAAAAGFQVLADDISLPAQQIAYLMSLGAAFYGAACAIANGFNLTWVFPSWESIRGAGNCSSTGGGDPPSVFQQQNVNPFYYLAPITEGPVFITPDAEQAVGALRADPLLLQGQQAAVSDLMRRAGAGISVAAP